MTPSEVAAMTATLTCHLTVKLRGRAEARDGAEGAQSLSARGAKPQAHHGPLQQLLEGSLRRSHTSSGSTAINSRNAKVM